MTLGKDMCTAKETPEPEKARIQFQVRFLTHSKLVNVIYLHLHICKRSICICIYNHIYGHNTFVFQFLVPSSCFNLYSV